MEELFKLTTIVYVYCTDFVINLANLFSVSYYEINALLFCILWPAVTVILLLIFIMQKIRLIKITDKGSRSN
jgi:hypothetical protein